MIRIQQEDFDVAALMGALRARTRGQAGGVVSFTGFVRDYAQDTATRSLTLEHYPGMCEREIATICAEAAARWQVLEHCVVHRVGELLLGEQIVFVAIASAHRVDAFHACEYVMNALKTRAPFWKRETLADGESFWVRQQGGKMRDAAICKTPAAKDETSTQRAQARTTQAQARG